MADLKVRQEKIKEVKLQNSFSDFLKQIVSRYPLVIYKNKGMLSLYPDTERSCPLVSTANFEQEREDFTKQGMEYDFSQNFFENFKNLYHTTSFPALYNYSGAENSDYAFGVYRSKNCYLSFSIITDCENIIYSFTVKEGSRNVLNSSQIRNSCNNIYQSLGIINSSNIFYSRFISDSSDIWFSTNLIGCHFCIRCDGLQNQSYCIDNKQLSKEEYDIESKKILGKKDQFFSIFSSLSQQGKNYGSQNSTGSFLLRSEDVKDGYYSLDVKDGKNLLVVGGVRTNTHMYDTFEAGSQGNSDFYGAINAGVVCEQLYNSEGIATCSNIYYSRFLECCSYCFGCIGLKNKQFCILNKQYEKDEWFALVEKIFAQMENDGILGQYFPASMNPFYFNDTVASLIGDFTKEEVEKEGYLWRDGEIKVDIPAGADVVETKDLDKYQGFNDKGERHINPEILKKVIRDEKGNFYRIVKMEYDFLMKYGLPLPEIHWLERIKLGFKFK